MNGPMGGNRSSRVTRATVSRGGSPSLDSLASHAAAAGCRDAKGRYEEGDNIGGVSPARTALIEHLRLHSLRTDGPFTLASGRVADWYLDARQTTFSGTGAPVVAAAVLEILAPGVVAVGGMTMGADPIAVATATMSEGRLNAFSIRKAAKDHGTGGRLVGPVQPGQAVAVLEDTTTTGAAFVEAVEVALEEGLDVVQAVSLFDRSAGTVERLMAQRSLPYVALVTPADLGVTL